MKRKFNRKKGKNMERPNKEDYGYVEIKGLVNKHSYFEKEGGEQLYKKAMKVWKEQEGRPCFETGIRDKINYCNHCHLYSECK